MRFLAVAIASFDLGDCYKTRRPSALYFQIRLRRQSLPAKRGAIGFIVIAFVAAKGLNL